MATPTLTGLLARCLQLYRPKLQVSSIFSRHVSNNLHLDMEEKTISILHKCMCVVMPKVKEVLGDYFLIIIPFKSIETISANLPQFTLATSASLMLPLKQCVVQPIVKCV